MVRSLIQLNTAVNSMIDETINCSCLQ